MSSMFDPVQYLTGTNGLFKEGDTFLIHNARLDGVHGNPPRERAKLSVQATTDGQPTGEPVIAYTSGSGIVAMVKRFNPSTDKGQEVRLDTLPARQPGHSPTFVLSRASDPPAAERAQQTTAVADEEF